MSRVRPATMADLDQVFALAQDYLKAGILDRAEPFTAVAERARHDPAVAERLQISYAC